MSLSYVQVANQQFSTELLASVVVRQQLNAHWTCTVVFRSTPDQRPDLESMQGQPLRITTYDLLGTEHVLFSGLVQRAAVRYEVWGSFGGTIEAVSLCSKMSVAQQYAYYLKQAPGDIAQGLAASSGLELAGTVEGDANSSRVQWEETDYDFLLQLADDAESWVRPSQTGLEVQSSFQPGVSLLWREGEYGLLEFSAGGQVRQQKLAGTQYDPSTMESQRFDEVQSAATFYDNGTSGLVQAAIGSGQGLAAADFGNRQRSISLSDFEERLQLESRRAAVNAVVCRGVSREMRVTAGDEVTVTGLPDGSGTYGVIACEHMWSGRGYENRFTATPARRWFAAVRPARARAGGLFPARVAANYDPHNQGRVQINFPWMAGAPTTWARLLMSHAGADRGMLFFPELGDEVAVRFEGGDPERPVVVGSVWNGVQQPPTEGFWQAGTVNETEFASNYIKRIVTKSGLRVTLNDTPGQESIHLATPSSNEVLMTEKAGETGRPAVALHTTGDIHIHARKGRVHHRAAKHSKQVAAPAPVKPKVVLIQAHQPSTQGLRNPKKTRGDNSVWLSNSDSEDLNANQPIILVRGGRPVTLAAFTVPAKLAVTWTITPNHTKQAPASLTPIDGGRKAVLHTDHYGSFAITATLGDTKVVWNVVFVWVEITSSLVTGHWADYKDVGDAATVKFESGLFSAFNPPAFGWMAKVELHLHGGGDDETLGVEKVIVGILQNGTSDTVTAHYTVAGDSFSTGKETIGTSLPVLDAQNETYPLFVDKNMTTTDYDGAPHRTLHAGDSPAVIFKRSNDHKPLPNQIAEPLQSITGVNGFRNSVASFSENAPHEFVVHGALRWTAHYDATVNPAGMCVSNYAHTSTDPQYTLVSPGTGGQDARLAGFETLPPVYIFSLPNGKPVIDVVYSESAKPAKHAKHGKHGKHGKH